MRIVLLIAVVLLSSACWAKAAPDNGPLQVTTPAGWTHKYDNSTGGQCYLISDPTDKTGAKNTSFPTLLMFSHWPAGGGPAQIPGYIDSMAATAQTNLTKDSMLKISGTARGKLTGGTISGQYVVFHMNNGVSQAIFMFNDGQTIWNGQFNGSPESWKIAQKILTDLKKNG